MTSDAGPYPEVRALERGLAIIDALGEFGWMGPTELARRTGIDRATVYRLLSTLARTGYVVRRRQDSKYFLTSKFKELSVGILEEDERALLVSEPLRKLVQEIHWPSDFAVLNAGRLVILDSNHPQTSMTFYRSVVGHTRPVLRTSLGRAILAAMSHEELLEALETIALAGGSDSEDIADRAAVHAAIEQTRRRGYALSVGEAEDNVTAIALPVMAKGKVAGAINIVFFRSAFSIANATGHLEALRRCVTEVEHRFQQLD